MDYKEKYEQALERMKIWMSEDTPDEFFDNHEVHTFVFPELKESDEEIIKEIISIVKSYRESCITEGNHRFDNCIAWLEKQGEQKSIWHNEDEEPKRGSLILLIMQNKTPIVAKIIEPNHTFNHGERWAYIDDLLEKQSEQILANSAKTCKNEQKPTDKVEPKFKKE